MNQNHQIEAQTNLNNSISYLESVLLLGKEYRQKNAINDAKRNYSIALEIDPNCKNAWLNLGALMAGVKLYDDAIDKLMLQGDPYGGYKLYHDKEHHRQPIALTDLKSIIRNQDYSIGEAFYLGELLLSYSQFDLANDFWTGLVMQHPSLTGAWMNLGVVKAKLNSMMEAKLIFIEKVLKKNPDFLNIHHNLSILYRKEKNFPLWVKYQLLEIVKNSNSKIHQFV